MNIHHDVTVGLDRPFRSPVTGVTLTGRMTCEPRKKNRGGCVITVTADGAPIADAARGLRIEPRVRGSRDGSEWKPFEWSLREDGVAPADVTITFAPRDLRDEIPWSVATDR